MRVLIITRNAWDDTNAIGNTLSNFFSGIEDVEFASIYFRESLPNNRLCKNYYKVSEIEVIKKWFAPNKIGKKIQTNPVETAECKDYVGNKERTLIRIIQKYGIKFAYMISDYIWYSEKWINKNFIQFIEEFSPDIMFAFVKSAPQYYLSIRYLREHYNIPLLTWIADDEYSGLLKKKSYREIRNLKYILNESAEVKGCSEELCMYYNSIFDCKAIPLYKGCELSTPVMEREKDTITIVYAGNLLYGRLEIIQQIARVLEEYSQNGKSISFEIYSNTALLTAEIEDYFGQMVSTKYMGKRDYSIIKEKLSNADIVLHVESFEEDEIIKTKYSFSTKIIDYLQSGSVILAVGPKEVASMRYICKIPGAFAINNLDNLDEELGKVLNDTSNYYQRAKLTREFALQYHDSAVVLNEITKTINRIIDGGE